MHKHAILASIAQGGEPNNKRYTPLARVIHFLQLRVYYQRIQMVRANYRAKIAEVFICWTVEIPAHIIEWVIRTADFFHAMLKRGHLRKRTHLIKNYFQIRLRKQI